MIIKDHFLLQKQCNIYEDEINKYDKFVKHKKKYWTGRESNPGPLDYESGHLRVLELKSDPILRKKCGEPRILQKQLALSNS